jgi:hypothetical protein
MSNETKEINNNVIGDWIYDVFVNDAGSLCFTVYEKGNADFGKRKDIFIDENLKVVSG